MTGPSAGKALLIPANGKLAMASPSRGLPPQVFRAMWLTLGPAVIVPVIGEIQGAALDRGLEGAP